MNSLLDIIFTGGAFFFKMYLVILKLITGRAKITVWIIDLLICSGGVLYRTIEKTRQKKEKIKKPKYPFQLQERQELYNRYFLIPYINDLEGNPLLKHFFNEGQRLEKESKFKEAIEEFRKCLAHPGATEENKVTANILIGNCYSMLNMLEQAEKYYKEALNISKILKDKSKNLQGKSAVFDNIGSVYYSLGKLNEALKCLKKALEINKKSEMNKPQQMILAT